METATCFEWHKEFTCYLNFYSGPVSRAKEKYKVVFSNFELAFKSFFFVVVKWPLVEIVSLPNVIQKTRESVGEIFTAKC